jgi:hypothetical protein
MKKAFLYHHLGLGDHLICNGLIRRLSDVYDLVVVPVKNQNYSTVQRMFADTYRIDVLPLTQANQEQEMGRLAKSFEVQGYEVVRLGYYGSDFMTKDIRFDENFYLQSEIPFSERWNSFYAPRNEQEENRIYNELVSKQEAEQFIFLHEDKTRSFLIDRSLLPTGIRIVEPFVDVQNNNFFDYRKVIENASQIHCIESSFAALIESMNLENKPKFAHRYSRPEAFFYFKHEFTYKTKWTIYK